MKSNGETLKKAYTARGILLITGELIPDIGESRLARSIIVNILPDSINLENLTILQQNTKQLNFAMKTYIKWVIENEQWVRSEAKIIMQNLQKSQNNQLHGRTNEGINCMQIGWYIYLTFLKEYNIINETTQRELEIEAKTILEEIAKEQTKEILEDKNPIDMFYTAIENMINTNTIYLLNYKLGTPINKKDKGTKLGYFDDNYYYLFPQSIYQQILSFYDKSKVKFPLSKTTLFKTLQNEGLLYMTDKSRKTVVRVDPFTKQKEIVIQVRRRDTNNEKL